MSVDLTDWLSEEINHDRFESIPVVVVAGSLRGVIVAGLLFDMQ